MTEESQRELAAKIAKRLGDCWLVIGPDGSTFQDKTPHRAANAANAHRTRLLIAHDPQKAAQFQAAIDDILQRSKEEDARLLKLYGTLNCPTCGGSGHVGDAYFARELPREPDKPAVSE